jgi:hypothetical protein
MRCGSNPVDEAHDKEGASPNHDIHQGKPMKKLTSPRIHALACGVILLVTAAAANAQSTTTQSTTTTTTDSNGTISDFTPSMITVRSESSSTPLSYSYSKTTTYVDENGNPVSTETIHTGAPVTVYYTQDGDRMVASRVVVHKTVTTEAPAPAPVVEEKKTSTTTTTTSGQ